MRVGNFEEIKIILSQKISEIFINCDMNMLSNYEKRKYIFNYLCDNLTYDFSLLEKIKLSKETGQKLIRNPYSEIESVIYNKIGICNAVAQYYKLLLEEVGIYSVCVICDDQTSVMHQLNLVYDQENDVYSFDDVTSVIVGRGSKEDFFDYDLSDANRLGQGNKVDEDGENWYILPTEYVHFLVGKNDNYYLKYGLEDVNSVFPDNIVSKKDINKKY